MSLLRAAIAILLLVLFEPGVKAQVQLTEPTDPAAFFVRQDNDWLLFLDNQTASFGQARLGTNAFFATLRTENGNSLDLLCEQGAGWLTPFPSLNQDCLLAPSLGVLPSTGLNNAQNQHLDAFWQNRSLLLGLHIGLSRLDASSSPAVVNGLPVILPNDASSYISLPPHYLPGIGLTHRSLGFGGILDLGSRRWVSLSATRVFSTSKGINLLGLLPNEWDTTWINLGIGYGTLSGVITGHVIDIPGIPPASGVDIGISWRTPWRGQLTVGASNIRSAGENPWLIETAPPAVEVNEARIPYVRYHQDL